MIHKYSHARTQPKHNPPAMYTHTHTHMHMLKPITMLTKYEYTRLRGFRLEQLANGAIPYVHVPDDASSTSTTLDDLFDQEAHAGVLPFKIKRDSDVVTTYRACIDAEGNLRTIDLTCLEPPSLASDDRASFTFTVQPSTTVGEVLALLNEAGGAARTLYHRNADGDNNRLDDVAATLWDVGIIEDATLDFD